MDREPEKQKESTFERILMHGKMARTEAQKDVAKDLLLEFIGQIVPNDEKVDNNVMMFLNQRIQQIDEIISSQVNEILHDRAFQNIEQTWRGLHYLVSKTETGPRIRLRLLSISKQELFDDVIRTAEFDQSQMFKKVYEEEYGTFGGAPFSCLVGDFTFSRTPEDVTLLEKIASIAAASHAPFLTAADPELFDMDSFSDLHTPRDLHKIFETVEMVKWNNFRSSEDSRYIVLTLPRILLRHPYGRRTTEGKSARSGSG